MTSEPPAASGPSSPPGYSTASRILIPLAAFVIVIAGLRAAVTIVVPFLMAVFLAIIATPALFWLKKKGISTGPAIALISLVILIAGLLVGALLAASIADFTKALPDYEIKLQKTINEWSQAFSGPQKTSSETSGRTAEKTAEPQAPSSETMARRAEDQVQKLTGQLRAYIQKYIHPNQIINVFKDLLAQLGAILANSFLIYVTMVFILMEASILPAKIQAALQRSPETFENLGKVADDVKRYLAIKTAISLATGVLVMILLTIIGVNYAILWGLIAFLLNFVPNIGSLIAAIPAVLLALLQLGPGSALLTALGYLVINITIGNFIEPRVLGRRLGLSTLVVFLSLIFWGWVLGPMGMLLSVPLTMVVKIILQTREDTRWAAILLGSEKPSLPKKKEE